MYVFLKEFMDNAEVEQIFTDWYHQKDKFEGRVKGRFNNSSIQPTLVLEDEIELANYESGLRKMKAI